MPGLEDRPYLEPFRVLDSLVVLVAKKDRHLAGRYVVHSFERDLLRLSHEWVMQGLWQLEYRGHFDGLQDSFAKIIDVGQVSANVVAYDLLLALPLFALLR